MAVVENNPFCVTVVGSRFFYKPPEEEEVEEDEIYRYAVVIIAGQKKQTEFRPGNQDGVEWGDVLQFDKNSIPQGSEIIIEVYVKWRMNSEFVGHTTIPYDTYSDNNLKFALLHWYPMKMDRPVDPSMKGEVGLIIGTYFGKGNAIKGKKFLSADDPAYDQMNADEVLVEAVKVAKENKQTVDRIVRLTEKTKNMAADNNQKLAEQSETITQIENDLETVNDEVILAEDKVKSMESCCFMFCRSGRAKKKVKRQQNIREKAKLKAAEAQRKAQEQREKVDEKAEIQKRKTSQAPGKDISELISQKSDATDTATTKGLKGELNKEVKEIDAGLAQIHTNVKDIKGMALDMKDKIDKDLHQLENTNDLATKDMAHLGRVADRTNRLI